MIRMNFCGQDGAYLEGFSSAIVLTQSTPMQTTEHVRFLVLGNVFS